MKFIIKHEIRGRLRIHVVQRKMTCAEADILFWYLDRQSNITDVKVYERTADAVICYTGERAALIRLLKSFRYEDTAVPETVVRNSGRKLNTSYKEKLIAKVLLHYGGRLLVPAPARVDRDDQVASISCGGAALHPGEEDRSPAPGCDRHRGLCPAAGL